MEKAMMLVVEVGKLAVVVLVEMMVNTTVVECGVAAETNHKDGR